jgi:hypothetical protein
MTQPTAPVTLVFADTETTSLRPDRRAWEIAAIVRPAGATREDDLEHLFTIDRDELDLGNADPKSLEISGFYRRHPQMKRPRTIADLAEGDIEGITHVYGEKWVYQQFEVITRGAWIVGAVPNFDTEVCAARMRATGVCPAWHYHLIDVEGIASGQLALPPPWGFDDLLNAYGLEYDEAERHTALGDARMARDLYDVVMARTVPDMIEQAWNIIANAGLHQGGWDHENPEWIEAAIKFRDTHYHPWLDRWSKAWRRHRLEEQANLPSDQDAPR